jgi:hypothetical protein
MKALIRTTNPRSGEQGYALIVVMALIACLIVYLSMASGAVLHTKQTDKRLADRQTMAVASSDILLRIISGDPPMEIKTDSGYQAKVMLEPAGMGDPIWKKLPGLKPMPGDQSVLIDWHGKRAHHVGEMYLVNLEGRRHGVIRISNEFVPQPSE